MALTAGGTVVAWGSDQFGQIDVPAGLTDVTAISAGVLHNVALRRSGSSAGLEARFTVLAPVVCVRLNTTSLDFGTVPLGGSRELTDATTLTACGDGVTVYGQADDAVTTGPSGAVWEPVVISSPPLCSGAAPLDVFGYEVTSAGTGTFLTNDAVVLGPLAAGGARTDTHTLQAACPASHGAGDSFTVAVTYTATAG